MSILNLTVTAESTGTQESKAQANRHEIVMDEPVAAGGQDAGPSPLQVVLCSLAGCENIIANMVAKEMNFSWQGIRFTIRGRIDLRGLRGDPDVRVFFEKVSVHAEVQTDESEERLQQLKEMTDRRCPVYTMLKAAGVELESSWTKV